MRFALSSKRVTIAMTLGVKDNTEDDEGEYVSNTNGSFGIALDDEPDGIEDHFGFAPNGVTHG